MTVFVYSNSNNNPGNWKILLYNKKVPNYYKQITESAGIHAKEIFIYENIIYHYSTDC